MSGAGKDDKEKGDVAQSVYVREAGKFVRKMVRDPAALESMPEEVSWERLGPAPLADFASDRFQVPDLLNRTPARARRLTGRWGNVAATSPAAAARAEGPPGLVAGLPAGHSARGSGAAPTGPPARAEGPPGLGAAATGPPGVARNRDVACSALPASAIAFAQQPSLVARSVAGVSRARLHSPSTASRCCCCPSCYRASAPLALQEPLTWAQANKSYEVRGITDLIDVPPPAYGAKCSGCGIGRLYSRNCYGTQGWWNSGVFHRTVAGHYWCQKCWPEMFH